MAYEMKENSGSLFANQKRKKDTHPNETGSALINGVEYWISSWTKTDKNGNKWQSLAFKPKDDKQGQAVAKPSGGFADMSDDVPF